MEFWYARDLQTVLDYSTWDKFKRVIQKAITACDNSGQPAENHFSQVVKMVRIGSNAQREIEDFELSRYACYLIVQNGDPTKPVIANGQTYFAIQTRRQELADNEAFQQLQEDEKRIFLRNELKEHNKQLVETAQQAGVETTLDLPSFRTTVTKDSTADWMPREFINARSSEKARRFLITWAAELAANLFRATQTEEKIRENIKGKAKANQTHYEVGTKVRQTIKDLGGDMPEDLPARRSKVPSNWSEDRRSWRVANE